jgi:regulatory protein
VRSTARKLETESDLHAAAVKLLARRAHSVHEMRRALERRAADKELVAPVLARLREGGYLDDGRYARQFARPRAQYRRLGRFRIARDLRARGVADRHIEAALDEVFAETDEGALLRRRIERKLRALSGKGPLDERKLASLYSSLLRAGFSADAIRRELRAVSRAAAGLPDPDGA